MKKILSIMISLLLVASSVWAADTKTSALTELAAAPAGTDQLYINDGGVSKRITVDNIYAFITSKIGAAYDTEAELLALFASKAPINLGTPTARTLTADGTVIVENGGFYKISAGEAQELDNFIDNDGGGEEDFNEGDWFYTMFEDADVTVICVENGDLECNQGVNFTASATQKMIVRWDREGTVWFSILANGRSSPTVAVFSAIDMGGGVLEIPNSASGDQALDTAGQIGLKVDEDLLVFHGGAAGEAQGEYAMSTLDHIVWVGDPANAYAADTQAYIMKVGDDYPHGMTIVEWSLSCNVDPDVEPDLDLKWADAFIGLGNAAVIDVMDTASGVASEDTAANINGGAAIANGKIIYFEFDSDPAGTCDQMVVEFWAYAEED